MVCFAVGLHNLTPLAAYDLTYIYPIMHLAGGTNTTASSGCSHVREAPRPSTILEAAPQLQHRNHGKPYTQPNIYLPIPQPLTQHDSIRLLILQPASTHGSDVHCSLIHTTLSNYAYDLVNHFTALSYVWGDAENGENIWIDGHQASVTANLHAALRDIRQIAEPIRMWADAICINQSDVGEKNIQVSMMSKIYAAADHTVIHLGVELGERDEEVWRVWADLNSNPSPSALYGAIASHDILIASLLKAAWFRRAWVFQELVLSKDPWVQLGKHVIWYGNVLMPFPISVSGPEQLLL
jgi:hypothetical protein